MEAVKTISKEQIRRVYALGSAIGALESGNKHDNLHALVQSLTGKASVSSLTDAEFHAVQHELLERMKMANRSAPLAPRKAAKKQPDAVPGMMTNEQQRLAWRMIYRLQELDTAPNTASVGDRMCGAIKKILEKSALPERPFVWVTFAEGQKLIEQLKRYVRTAERRQRANE